MTSVKLGRLPRLKGFNAPKLGPAIAAAVSLPPTPPASVDWYSAVGNAFGTDGNLTVGDCTIACQAHLIQAWTTNAGKPFAPSQADCLAKYAALSGWDGTPGDASDVGLVVTKVLADWQTNGLDGHKLSAWAEIDVKNRTELMNAISWFGGVYIGLNLPISLQSVIEGNLQPAPLTVTWDVVPGVDSAARSWGGHAVPILGFNATGPVVVSWGAVYQMTWPFYEAYVDEAYAPISADFIEATGSTPGGLTLAQLQADLAAVGEPTTGPSSPLVLFLDAGNAPELSVGAMLSPDVILAAPGTLAIGLIEISAVAQSYALQVTAIENYPGFSLGKLSGSVACDHYAGYTSTFTGGVAQIEYYTSAAGSNVSGAGAAYENFTVSGNIGTCATVSDGAQGIVYEESPEGNGITLVGVMTSNGAAYVFTSSDINNLEYGIELLSDCSPAIQRLYLGLLGRPGSAAELQWYNDNGWKAAYAALAGSGVPSAAAVLLANPQFVSYFTQSSEFVALNTGYGTNPTLFVNYVYETALGRTAAPVEVTYWVNAIGSMGYPAVIASITQSAEAIQFLSVRNVG
jgi:hypothetical protein